MVVHWWVMVEGGEVVVEGERDVVPIGGVADVDGGCESEGVEEEG